MASPGLAASNRQAGHEDAMLNEAVVRFRDGISVNRLDSVMIVHTFGRYEVSIDWPGQIKMIGKG